MRRRRPRAAADLEAGFVEVCRELHPRLVRGLTLHCRDEGVAQDAAQDALARAWERWPTVRTTASPEAWVWRVALNLTTSRFRRKAAEHRAHARLGPRPSPAGAPDEHDELAIRAAVADLPRRQRAALVLRYYADLSVAETADALDCAPGTVKSLTAKAVAGLRVRLGEAVDPVAGPDTDPNPEPESDPGVPSAEGADDRA